MHRLPPRSTLFPYTTLFRSWDNPERARQVIAQLKPLNGLIEPFQDLEKAIGDLGALCELADEDASLEGDVATELQTLEKRFGASELRAMLSGPQDAATAFLRVPAGGGRTDACDCDQTLMRLYTSLAE